MKKHSSISILLLIFLGSVSDVHSKSEKNFLTQISGFPGYSFGNDVRIRKTPSADGEIVGKLMIAEKFTINEATKTNFTSSGIENPWINITTSNGINGYVWGGLLARAIQETELPGLGKGTLILGLLNRTNGTLNWAFRFIQNGNLVKEFSVTGPQKDFGVGNINDFSCSVDLNHIEVVGHKEFYPELTMINIHFYDCTGCDGGSYADYYYSWNEKNLSFAFSFTGAGGVFYSGHVYSLTFPSTGIPNCILLNSYDINYTYQANTDPVPQPVININIEVYQWNGDWFNKINP